MGEAETLVDRIYEASVISEFWPDVLQEFSLAAEAKDAVLSVERDSSLRVLWSSPHFEQLFRRHYDYPGGRERTRRLLAVRKAGFVTDADVYSEQEILAEPLFAEYAIPNGYGSGVATAIYAPSGEAIIIHAERAYGDGPYSKKIIDRIDALRPHLARAALLSARLGRERARAAAAALEAVGLPAAVLDLRGCILSVNDLFSALVPEVAQDRSDRVVLTNPAADALLKEAMESVRSPSNNQAVCSIPIPANARNPAMIIHILPVKGDARDVFLRSSIILVVTPVVAKQVPGANVLQALFDLTPAEARVAHEVGNGRSIEEISDSLGTSMTTVRNQIAAVLSKSALHRRIDLVALLQGSAIGRP